MDNKIITNNERVRSKWRENNAKRLLDETPEAREARLNKSRAYYAEHKDRYRELNRAWNDKNRDRRNAACNAWRAANPKRLAAMKRKGNLKKLGATIEIVQETLQKQFGRCYICKTDEPGGRGWTTDHCHATGKFRAVLCQRCNVMLGMSLDNPDTLRKGAIYLEIHRYGTEP